MKTAANHPQFSYYDYKKKVLLLPTPGFVKRDPQPLLGAKKRFSRDHVQRHSLVSFTGAFTSIAKPKCNDIKYLPVNTLFGGFDDYIVDLPCEVR